MIVLVVLLLLVVVVVVVVVIFLVAIVTCNHSSPKKSAASQVAGSSLQVMPAVLVPGGSGATERRSNGQSNGTGGFFGDSKSHLVSFAHFFIETPLWKPEFWPKNQGNVEKSLD